MTQDTVELERAGAGERAATRAGVVSSIGTSG